MKLTKIGQNENTVSMVRRYYKTKEVNISIKMRRLPYFETRLLSGTSTSTEPANNNHIHKPKDSLHRCDGGCTT